MKNEREKEIERVYPLNRHSGGLLKRREKPRQPITNHQQQKGNNSISRPRGEIKKQGRRTCAPLLPKTIKCKEKVTKEKKWNWKN
jgi:hypothetical protein